MAQKLITQEQMMQTLDKIYKSAMEGLSINGFGSESCNNLAQQYLIKYQNVDKAANRFIDAQIAKCSISGFVTSLGGLITLPVAIPANVVSVIYVQMRMIGTLAVMGGYDLHDDEVQTLVYLCLVRSSITDALKTAGVKVTEKLTIKMLKNLPGTVLTKINQMVGFRFITKFGTRGVVNLAKVIPVVSGFTGAAIDWAATRAIANQAKSVFLEGNLD